MRAFGVLFAVLMLAGCGGGSSAAERVTKVVVERGYDKDVSKTSCAEMAAFKGYPGMTGWNCTLTLEAGGKGTCYAIDFEDEAHLERCDGLVVDPPSLEYVQQVMLDGHDDAERARCSPDGARAWRCVLVVSHGADGSGRYEALPDGSSVIEGTWHSSLPAEP